VNNAFLHGLLDENIYAWQPAGFINTNRSDHICKLNKSLYGLKQAPRAWYTRFASFLDDIGFTPTKSESSLFVLLAATTPCISCFRSMTLRSQPLHPISTELSSPASMLSSSSRTWGLCTTSSVFRYNGPVTSSSYISINMHLIFLS
jgi:hypothetical protein